MVFTQLEPLVKNANAHIAAALDTKRPMDERLVLATVAQAVATLVLVQAQENAGILGTVRG